MGSTETTLFWQWQELQNILSIRLSFLDWNFNFHQFSSWGYYLVFSKVPFLDQLQVSDIWPPKNNCLCLLYFGTIVAIKVSWSSKCFLFKKWTALYSRTIHPSLTVCCWNWVTNVVLLGNLQQWYHDWSTWSWTDTHALSTRLGSHLWNVSKLYYSKYPSLPHKPISAAVI